MLHGRWLGGGEIDFALEGDAGGRETCGLELSFLDEKDVGAVRHFENIGHVGGGRDVENGVLVAHAFEDIEHFGAEDSAVNRIRFAGFEPDFDIVFRAGFADEADQSFAIVERFGDPVASAHIEIGELGGAEQVAEFRFDGGEGFFEVVGVLFAERVEMKAGESGEVGPRELVGGDAKTRPGDAGVVDGCGPGGALGIDSQAAVEFAVMETRMGSDDVAEAEPLRKRVEIEVMRELAELADLLLPVGGRVGDDLFSEVVACEQGFPKAGGAAAVEVIAEVGEGFPAREALESENDLAVGCIGSFAQDGGVALEGGEGNDERSHVEKGNAQDESSKFQVWNSSDKERLARGPLGVALPPIWGQIRDRQVCRLRRTLRSGLILNGAG